MNLFDLTGKKAIVTGGTRGLGYGMAEGLIEAGAEVVIFGSSGYMMWLPDCAIRGLSVMELQWTWGTALPGQRHLTRRLSAWAVLTSW